MYDTISTQQRATGNLQSFLERWYMDTRVVPMLMVHHAIAKHVTIGRRAERPCRKIPLVQVGTLVNISSVELLERQPGTRNRWQ